MPPFLPRLRTELRLVEAPDGADASEGASLLDPVVNRTVNLGPVSRALLPLLDGTREVPDILAEVAAARALSEDRVEHTLRTLLLMNLVEGAGDGVRARAAAVRRGERRLQPTFLDGARFACQGSGGCCQGYTFGPLDQEDVDAIEARDLDSAFPALRGVPRFILERTEGKGDRAYLHTVDGRCIFLEGDHRCGLHARFGPDAKPRFCRFYPLEVEATIDGLRIGDRGECASFARSARSGPLFVDDAPRILSLLPPLDTLVLDHPIVLLDGATPCDFGWFLALRGALLALVEEGEGRATAGETVAALGHALGRFVDVVGGCPVAPGEPDATVERFVRGGFAGDYAAARSVSPEDLAFARLHVPRICVAILDACQPELAQSGPEGALPRSFAAVVTSLHELFREGPGAPGHAALMALGSDGDDLDAVLRISLRQQLFGSRALIDSRPAPALLRTAFVYLLSSLGARLSALAEGADRVTADHLSTSHVLAVRMLRGPRRAAVFLDHADSTWAVCAAAATLLGDVTTRARANPI